MDSRVVMILTIVAAAMAAGVEAQQYTCWGGCYNVCIMRDSANNPQGLSCYYQCLTSQCVPRTPRDYEYYCQIGCSLQSCDVLSYDGGRLEQCLEGCNNQCKF